MTWGPLHHRIDNETGTRYRLNGLSGFHRPPRTQHALTDKDAPKPDLDAAGKPTRFSIDAIDCTTVVDLRYQRVAEALGLGECLACLQNAPGKRGYSRE